MIPGRVIDAIPPAWVIEKMCKGRSPYAKLLPEDRPMDRPRIVVLCGSTRFGDAYRDAMRAETLAGKIVLTVGLLGHQEGIDMDGPVKKMLDQLHLRKIYISDEVLILNVGGYVGESTRREIAYARSLGKTIRWLERTDDVSS